MSPDLHIYLGGHPVDIYLRPVSGSERLTAQALADEIFGTPSPITHTAEGAPEISSRPTVEISVSHSGGILAMAIAPRGTGIGIDIERTDRTKQLRRIITRFLTPAEAKAYTDNLTEAWTLKAALYKSHRGALSPSLTDYAIPPACPWYTTAIPMQALHLSITMIQP